jgi:hypothetical protein
MIAANNLFFLQTLHALVARGRGQTDLAPQVYFGYPTILQ